MRAGLYMIVIVTALLYTSSVARAQYGQPQNSGPWGNWGYNAPRDGPWNYCPNCGRPWGPYGGYGMDPGGRWNEQPRMQPEPKDRGYGPGREPGYGYGPYSPRYQYPPYQRGQQKLLDESNARKMMEGYLDYTENPNLKVGEIREQKHSFEAEIVTKNEGALVDKVIIDKITGWMRFAD
jgi:hypothetical protein